MRFTVLPQEEPFLPPSDDRSGTHEEATGLQQVKCSAHLGRHYQLFCRPRAWQVNFSIRPELSEQYSPRSTPSSPRPWKRIPQAESSSAGAPPPNRQSAGKYTTPLANLGGPQLRGTILKQTVNTAVPQSSSGKGSSLASEPVTWSTDRAAIGNSPPTLAEAAATRCFSLACCLLQRLRCQNASSRS